MSVTRLNVFKEVGMPVPLESPVDGINLVFEEIDFEANTGMLERETVRRHITTLRRGFGCNYAALPVQLSALAALVRADKKFTISTSKFVDLLWECMQLAGPDELAA